MCTTALFCKCFGSSSAGKVIIVTIKNLPAKKEADLKALYEQDYKTELEKSKHIHRHVYSLSGTTAAVGTKTFPIINLSQLNRTSHTTLATFLKDRISASGIRPDTPFHKNDDATPKYTDAGVNSYRYMEYNTIGGGMRLVYDHVAGEVFLSSHYSDPALIRADGGSAELTWLQGLIARFSATWHLMYDHSEGIVYNNLHDDTVADDVIETRRDQVRIASRASPAFIAWLGNKNSAQSKKAVLDLYNLAI